MTKYKFSEWKDETGSTISIVPEIDVVIDKDKELIAVYESKELPPPINLALALTLLFGVPIGIGAAVTVKKGGK